MNIAFCMGNGHTIDNIDLESIKDVGPTYGCNSLIDKFELDNTIVVDKNLLIDLISRGINKKTNIYTRKRWHKLVQADNLYFLDEPVKNPSHMWDNEIHWGSGVHAINLAAKHKAEVIIMLGYDLYNSNLNPNCWIYQIRKCFELYPEIQFVQIQNEKWECPSSWDTDNFTVDDLENLNNLIKDLH